MNKIGKLKVKSSDQIEKSCVSIGFECLDRDLYKPEKCYDLAAKTGVKHARVQTGWAKCEKEKGVYDFSWLDSIVDNLLERKIFPWFNVGYGNPIYMHNIQETNSTAVGCVPTLYGDDVITAWINYITALAKHYKGRITHFEIWNEADIKNFWYPGRSNGKELANLVKITGAAIRKVIPDAKIGTCSSGSAAEYLYDLFSNLTKDDIDFFCFHTYSRLPELCPNLHYNLELIKEIVKENNLEHVEFWMGEGGHASWHPIGHFQCKEGGGSEHRQAVWHLRRFFLNLEADIKLTSIFLIADMWERHYEMANVAVQKKPAAQGILNGITYTPKKAHETFGYISAVLSGDCKKIPPFASILYLSYTPVKNVFFSSNGKNVIAYWMALPVEDEDATPRFCKYVSFIPSKRFADPVVIDMFTGEVFELEDDSYNNLPIGEYPRLICERDTFDFK